MAKSKLTKFRLPPAKILRFNPTGKAISFVPDKTDIDRELIESVLGFPLTRQYSPADLAAMAAAFVETGMARA